LAVATLAARPARAQETSPPAVALLTTPAGLSALKSSIPSGLVASRAQLDSILRGVSALDLTARFLGDAGPSQRVGSVELAGGADVTLKAHLVRQPGQDAAALDSLELNATGVKVAGLSVRRVTVGSDGAMQVQLDRWMPNVSIKQVEHKSNGDVVLHTPWWLPNVTVSPDGTTRTRILGIGMKVGKVDARVFAKWPPSVESLASLLPDGPADAPPKTLSELAGTLSWNASGSLANDTLALSGKPIDGTVDATVAGSARLEKGTLTTIGDANTVSLAVRAGPQSLSVGSNTGDLTAASVQLDGRYRLSVPLDDPGKKLAIEFDGQASYAVSGSNVQLSLPEGAKVSIGSGDATGTQQVTLKTDPATGLLELNGTGDYVAHVQGPIQIENLGAVQSLGVDGTLGLNGKATIADDHLTLDGKISGDHQVMTDGFVQVLAGTATARGLIQAGSQVNLDVSDAQAKIRLGLRPSGDLEDVRPGFAGGSAAGTLTGKVGLDDVSVRLDTGAMGLALDGSANARVDAPFAASVGPDGRLVVDPSKTRATIPVDIALDQGSTLEIRDPSRPTRFTLDRGGSTLRVTGQLSFDERGQPVLTELDHAHISLKLGAAPAVIAGLPIGDAADKTVSLDGRVVFRPNGLDVYGTFGVTIEGTASTPILSIDYAPKPTDLAQARPDDRDLDPALRAAIQKRDAETREATPATDALLKDALDADRSVVEER
jgi:hypothetical protein